MRARSWNMSRLLGDRDEAAFAARLEHDRAVALGEDRVVAADAGARARAEARATLPDDDRAGGHALAGEDLHAEHLRVGVTAVPRRAESLLMRHRDAPSSLRAPQAHPCASRAPARTPAPPRPVPTTSGLTSR